MQKVNYMKQGFGILTVLFLIILFSVFVYYKDLANTHKNQSTECANNIQEIKNKYLQQIDAIEYNLPDSVELVDVKGIRYSIDEQIKTPRIGIYIDPMQCVSCWEDDLKILTLMYEELNIMTTPIVLCDKYSRRELNLMQKKIAYPLYKIEGAAKTLDPLIKFNMPFFFIIDNEGVISSAFIPSKSLPKYILEAYFKMAKKRTLAPEEDAREVDIVFSADDLELQNPVVDLGEVGLRTKREVGFKVKNNRKEKCLILDANTSCSCITLDVLPRIILPGETEVFTVNFVASSNGKFNQSLRLKTNFQNQPYTMRITGVVK